MPEKQLVRLDAERARERRKGGDADVLLAALDPADIGAVIAADVRKLLLRNALRLAQPPHIGTDDALQAAGLFVPRRHAGMGRKCRLTVYTL